MWKTLWTWLQTWQGAGSATIAVLAAIYYGPRKMLETWDWYINRHFDEPVLDVLKDQALLPPAVRPRPLEGLSVDQLAHKLHRSQPSIGKSIRRLRRKGLIEYDRGGFRIKE